MKTFFKWLLLSPIIVAIALFALLNRQNVPVVIDPFGTDVPGMRFEAPLFFVMFLCGAIGVVVGSIVTWLGQGKHRREARSAKSEAARLLNENERLRALGQSSISALPPPSRNAA
jgi:uncharacterized integral membrane protein